MIGRRILVLSPHPDDEVVGAAAAIRRAQAEGAEIFLLHLTSGVPGPITTWFWKRVDYPRWVEQRRIEAFAVAKALGVTIIGASQRNSRTLKDDLPAVRREVLTAINRLNIDRLWVPAYEGGHADHDVANGLAATLSNMIAVGEFAEYNFLGGRTNVNKFPILCGHEIVLELSQKEARSKTELLGLYASERKNLGYVEVERECFRPLVAYNYRRPPHEGLLFYRRFQWVPFRHPRIDLTQPREVCTAITDLMGQVLERPLDGALC
ncbi:MAG: PIG-L family deacetylase [Rhodospirillaceae bacterium]